MPKLIMHQNKFPCYNGLLYRHGKYLYSSRSGQIWKTKLPEVASLCGSSIGRKVSVFCLSRDKSELTIKLGDPQHRVEPLQAREYHISAEILMYTIHNNKHYWLYKEMLHEVKWVRSSVTEYLIVSNFS
jgi:hypothetical protein